MADLDWTAVRADYESGDFSQSALERKHGVSRKAIANHAAKEQWSQVTGHRSQVTPKQAPSDSHSTPKKALNPKAAFLESYATHANVMMAARAAGVHRTTVYTWLEKDEAFSLAYHQAKEDAKDVLRAEIYRRAHDGVEEPVYQSGVLAGTVKKYSDTLLIFHSKALMPEYREKSSVELTGKDGGPLESRTTLTIDLTKLRDASPEQLAALRALAIELKGKE